MYNYDKIRQEIEKFEIPIVEPKQGDLYIGVYNGTVSPSGMLTSYIDLQQEYIEVYIPFTKSLDHALTKAGAVVGDHIALYVKGIHNFTKWGGKMPHWACKKLVKVGDEYE